MFSFEGFVRVNTFLAGAYRLVLLNLLWLATTVLGLGVLGFGPASYALARYVDRWFRLGEEPPVVPAFVAAVREHFWRSAALGWVYLGAGAVVVTNLYGSTSWTVRVLNLVALGVLAVSLSYAFSVLAALDVRTVRETVAASLMVGLGSLHLTIIGGAAVLVTASLLYRFALPVLALLGAALPAAAVGVVTRVVYRDLEEEPGQPSRRLAPLPGTTTVGDDADRGHHTTAARTRVARRVPEREEHPA